MKLAIIHAKGNVCVEERPIPTLQTENDVLVKVVSFGSCGSDIPRIFVKGAYYYPIMPGHESSSHVESYGAAVADLQSGNVVVCVSLPLCFQCPQCQREYLPLCKQYQLVGSRSEGGNAEYMAVKRANLFRLPDQMLTGDGVLIEPITVDPYASYLAQGCEGRNVIIIGMDTIDLLVLQCARKLGVNSITAIDINPQKLELAKALGVIRVFNSREASGRVIQQMLEAIQFDQLAFGTVGTPQTVTLAIKTVDPRAQLALVSTPHHDLTLLTATSGQVLRKELSIVNSWMNYSGLWPGGE